ncbi:hypothetical protein [Medusavirus stheno T3]|uniref:Uncharacterized protein n=1 Tax=Medusavirus stheno T3 TaxID=3069717 RepID=A0A7S7YEV5_9VIRU|nr:hypothetical protein QKU73_gp254 [Acanthamoeba castellanii medusavirus]QPB44521.1 hypothetical protein [Medusavirus stheno T3]
MKAHIVGLLAALTPSPDTASWPVLDEDRPERSSREDITARILNRGRGRSSLDLIQEIIKAGIMPVPLHHALKHIHEIGTNPAEDPAFPPLPGGCYLAVALFLLLSYVCDTWPSTLFESPQATFNFKIPSHTMILDGDDDGLCFSLVDHCDAGGSLWDIEPAEIVKVYAEKLANAHATAK